MHISKLLGAIGAAAIAVGAAHAEEDLRPDAGEIVVTGVRVPDSVDGALGAATRLRDVPQGVSVVPDYVIELQQPLSLTDIARNTPSISNFRNSSETFRTLSIRGFVQYETTIDGLRNTNALDIQPDGLASIERVEIIRGPATALYGRGSLGGAVNIVTRKPEEEFGARGELDLGDPELVRATLDITGPLATSASGRLIAASSQRESFIDFVDVDEGQIAPSLRFDWGETSLLVQADYRERRQLRYVGLPLYGTITGLDDLVLDIGANFGEPDLPETVSTGLQFTTIFDHAFSDAWSARAALRYTENTYDQYAIGLRTLGADSRTLSRNFNRFDDSEDEIAAFLSTDFSFSTGSVGHRVRLAAEHARYLHDSRFFSGGVAPIDIENPVYGAQPTGVLLLDDTTDEVSGSALAVQDHVTLTSRLKVLLGGRMDWIDTSRRSNLAPGAGQRDIAAFSPRVGATYDATSDLILYASWGRNIEAQHNGGSNATLTPFEPVEGEQYEGGVKWIANDRVSATFGLYRIDATGVLTTDPNDPNGFSIQTGERRSQGVELELNWQPIPSLTLAGYATYTDAEIVRDTDFAPGSQIENVPEYAARLFALYEAPAGGALEGFSINGAVTYQDEQAGNLANSFRVPESTIVDAGLGYDFGTALVRLQVRNLFDERHFIRGAFDGRNIVPGDPRTVFLTLGYALGAGD